MAWWRSGGTPGAGAAAAGPPPPRCPTARACRPPGFPGGAPRPWRSARIPPRARRARGRRSKGGRGAWRCSGTRSTLRPVGGQNVDRVTEASARSRPTRPLLAAQQHALAGRRRFRAARRGPGAPLKVPPRARRARGRRSKRGRAAWRCGGTRSTLRPVGGHNVERVAGGGRPQPQAHPLVAAEQQAPRRPPAVRTAHRGIPRRSPRGPQATTNQTPRGRAAPRTATAPRSRRTYVVSAMSALR